jgi:hypothetical protein
VQQVHLHQPSVEIESSIKDLLALIQLGKYNTAFKMGLFGNISFLVNEACLNHFRNRSNSHRGRCPLTLAVLEPQEGPGQHRCLAAALAMGVDRFGGEG